MIPSTTMPFAYIDIHTHQPSSDPEIFSIVCAPSEKDDGKSSYSWGIHPCFIQAPEVQLQQVKSALLNERWIALGECGLDKLSATPLPLQIRLFEAQIRLSEQYEKPLIIHCVKAWAELIAVRRKMHPFQPWIIHGFRGKKELALQLLREGLYLSFGRFYHEASLSLAWPSGVFLETDDAAVSIREIYHHAASVLGLSESEIQTRIQTNCAECGLSR